MAEGAAHWVGRRSLKYPLLAPPATVHCRDQNVQSQMCRLRTCPSPPHHPPHFSSSPVHPDPTAGTQKKKKKNVFSKYVDELLVFGDGTFRVGGAETLICAAAYHWVVFKSPAPPVVEQGISTSLLSFHFFFLLLLPLRGLCCDGSCGISRVHKINSPC